jgi:hypothetical protein
MSFAHCPKCGTKIHGAVACKHCGRMPTAGWPFRTAPPKPEQKPIAEELKPGASP